MRFVSRELVRRQRHITLNLVLCSAMLSVNCRGPERDSTTFTSPTRKYQVEASGDFSSPTRLFVKHRAVVKIAKDGIPYVQPFELYSADMADTGFRDQFNDHAWLHDNVLRLIHAERVEGAHDDVIIRNETVQDIQYAVVNAGDLLVAIDMKAGSVTRLEVEGQRKVSTLFLEFTGRFSDGTGIKNSGMSFFVPKDEPANDARYIFDIRIRSTGVVFELLLPDGTKGRVLSSY
jgi:hypothetical protein